jgi:hypothetical protein
MNEFTCRRCARPVYASILYAQRNWPVGCNYCGAIHNPSGDAISPAMIPVGARTNCAYSPWQFARTRPVVVGNYHCRFRELDCDFLTLYWNGRYFQPSREDDRPVQMATLLSWRGRWAE